MSKPMSTLEKDEQATEPSTSESKIEEIAAKVAELQASEAADEGEEVSGDEEEEEAAEDGAEGPKVSKKKRKGVKKLLDKLSGSKEKELISPELYERILEQVKHDHGEAAAAELLGKREEVAAALQEAGLKDLVEGKKGLGKGNRKELGEHKFWSTQPVMKGYGMGEDRKPVPEGPIEPNKQPHEIRQEPIPLPGGYEWCTMDINDPAQLKEVYELLTANFVEDDDAMFRFDYQPEFISWALKGPGYVPEWHVGVRMSTGSRKLVAFIAGVPLELRVRKVTKRASEINLLCVHKKLRSKRLAPVLIKEVTRRCNLKGVFQAVYTAGAFLPTPVSTCRYYHRPLNPKKLVATGFSKLPKDYSIARLTRNFILPPETKLAGLREMERKDVKQVAKLLRCYLARLDLAPIFSNKEVEHFTWGGRGAGEIVEGRRTGQVTWAYVVEDPTTGKITDFVSFYSLPSTALPTPARPRAQNLNACYLFYYASTSCPACTDIENKDPNKLETIKRWDEETVEERSILSERLNLLLEDALIIAQKAQFDVFNTQTIMDNNLFLERQKFRPGDGALNYYLYNYSTNPIKGGEPVHTSPGSGIGLTML
ncbi:N-myristoyl transferase [Atractiella rhizophila]|nr:N-myristoyl transferase [Atractiella rhizophila]